MNACKHFLLSEEVPVHLDLDAPDAEDDPAAALVPLRHYSAAALQVALLQHYQGRADLYGLETR